MQYFREVEGRLHAILNSMLRRTNAEVMISEPLDTRELTVYQSLKGQGQTDSQIFQTLFPSTMPRAKRPSSTKVEIKVEQLNKRQLIHLVLQELNTSIASLSRMSTADLRKLLVSLQGR